jgi:hypothetical protein
MLKAVGMPGTVRVLYISWCGFLEAWAVRKVYPEVKRYSGKNRENVCFTTLGGSSSFDQAKLAFVNRDNVSSDPTDFGDKRDWL